MFRKIDHIGVAVRSLAGSARLYAETLGLPLGAIETVEREGVRVAFLGDGETHIELLEPLDSSGPIARFLEKRGEGFHHLCFEVADIREAVAKLCAAGIELAGEAPRPGARGREVAFIHPRSSGGVLIELSETPAAVAGRIAPGRTVVAYLRDPKEKYWGILRELSGAGATIEGIEVSSFEEWAMAASSGAESAAASTVFFYAHRVEKIFLDQPSAGVESLEDRFRSRTGRGLAAFLAGEAE